MRKSRFHEACKYEFWSIDAISNALDEQEGEYHLFLLPEYTTFPAYGISERTSLPSSSNTVVLNFTATSMSFVDVNFAFVQATVWSCLSYSKNTTKYGSDLFDDQPASIFPLFWKHYSKTLLIGCFQKTIPKCRYVKIKRKIFTYAAYFLTLWKNIEFENV